MDNTQTAAQTTTPIHYRTDVEPGDLVRLTADSRCFDQLLEAGSIGTVISLGGSHHTMNGGGFDVEILVEGRRWPSFLIVDGKWAMGDDGKYLLEADVRDTLTVNSRFLGLVR